MASVKDDVLIITFGTSGIKPLLFDKWMEGVALLISARDWRATGFGGFVHIVGQNVLVKGGQNIEKALSLLGCFGFASYMISERVYACQPRDGHLGPHDFVDCVQAWRSKSQWRADYCHL